MCMSEPNLPDDHFLRSLLDEHATILTLVDRLENVCDRLSTNDVEGLEEHLVDLLCLVHYLNRAESHDQREERVLFPALALRGVNAEPADVLEQHQKVATLKEQLRERITPSLDQPWRPDLEAVTRIGRNLCTVIRSHIEFEETVLFPLALESITEEDAWAELAAAAPAENPRTFELRARR